MRQLIPYLLLALGVVIGALSLWGADGYPRLMALRNSLRFQQDSNAELGEKVDHLRYQVHGVQSNDRMLEKAARDELGMARPNERVFVFEENSVAPSDRP